MRISVFIVFMTMTMGVYAQKYKVGTTTALWKVPASTDFSQARSVGLEYVEVAFNQCYRGVPANEVIPRVRDMKAKIDSAGIKVWSIHLPFSRTLDISVLDEKKRKENVDFMVEMIEQCAQFQPKCLVLHPSSEPIDDSIRGTKNSQCFQVYRLSEEVCGSDRSTVMYRESAADLSGKYS